MNIKKQLIIILSCLFTFVIQVQSQTKEIRNSKQDRIVYNLKDSLGRKQGLWIESFGDEYSQVYYKDNVREGIYRRYVKTGRLIVFGEYHNGLISGKWYFFVDEVGHLSFTSEDDSLNWAVDYKYIYSDGTGTEIIPVNSCYIKMYYPNGIIEKEGRGIYDEDILIGINEVGLWKYYDKTGKLIKTKNYNPTKKKLTKEEKSKLLNLKNGSKQ